MNDDSFESAAIALVTEYQTARHAWEREAAAIKRRARNRPTPPEVLVAFDAKIAPFFVKPYSRPDRSYGDPPGVDPATTEFIGVTRRRGRIVVTTREIALPGFEVRANHEYILTEVDGRLRIADIRAEVDPGTWVSLMR